MTKEELRQKLFSHYMRQPNVDDAGELTNFLIRGRQIQASSGLPKGEIDEAAKMALDDFAEVLSQRHFGSTRNELRKKNPNG